MFPPRVSDQAVREVIRELSTGQDLPSGAAVRAALETRFGSRGGVARIYRLLAEERVRRVPPPEPGSVESLRIELRIVREKLARAEEREEAHQTRWAAEVDQLRLKVTALESVAAQTRSTGQSNELLRRQLQVAELRAAMLEQQLYQLAKRDG